MLFTRTIGVSVADAVLLSTSSSVPAGVLFTVEVMCSHFALRYYCPCFFSAACGALTFRLLSVWSGDIGNGGLDQCFPPHGQEGEDSFLESVPEEKEAEAHKNVSEGIGCCERGMDLCT